jgi:hypothetical protein
MARMLARGGVLALGFCFNSVCETRELSAVAFPSIVVRTYDAAATSTESQQLALLESAVILDRAGIRVLWIRCDAGDVYMPECRTPLGTYELAMRLIALPEHRSKRTRPLGEAHVDIVKRGGSFATVFANRVRWFADASGVDFSTVLGRAIAHEIGHLVMGSTAHPASGLMRAVWAPQDVAGDYWLFTERDALTLRHAIVGRALPGSPRGPEKIRATSFRLE